MASLFQECVEALNAVPFSSQENLALGEEFKKCFPITKWGKIDWDQIDHKIEIGYDPDDVLPGLEKLFGRKIDTTVYILWSSARYPIIKTDLKKIVTHFDDVTCVSHEKFIFNLKHGYILEILFGGSMTLGLVPECAKKYDRKEKL